MIMHATVESKHKVRIDTNCSWVTITIDGKVVYEMTPNRKDWYQGRHGLIGPGLSALGELVRELCGERY